MIRFVASMLALAALSIVPESVAPAVPQTVAPQPIIQPPPALAARAKFPNEPVKAIDGLAFINNLGNHSLTYVEDQEQYGRPEVYFTPLPGGKGDCEDFALFKREIMRQSGVPVMAVTRLRNVVVTNKATGESLGGHVILEILLPRGAIAFMDINFPDLMTRKELEDAGYKFFDWPGEGHG